MSKLCAKHPVFVGPSNDGGIDLSWTSAGLFAEITGAKILVIQHDPANPAAQTAAHREFACSPEGLVEFCEFVTGVL